MHTCISSHGLKRSWHSCPRRVNAGNKNTPSTHHPQRRNTLNGWIKKRPHKQKSHPKVVNPRDIAGERKKKKYLLHQESVNVENYIVSAAPIWQFSLTQQQLVTVIWKVFLPMLQICFKYSGLWDDLFSPLSISSGLLFTLTVTDAGQFVFICRSSWWKHFNCSSKSPLQR